MKSDTDDALSTTATGEKAQTRGGGSGDRLKQFGDGETLGSPQDNKDEPERAEPTAEEEA